MLSFVLPILEYFIDSEMFLTRALERWEQRLVGRGTGGKVGGTVRSHTTRTGWSRTVDDKVRFPSRPIRVPSGGSTGVSL